MNKGVLRWLIATALGVTMTTQAADEITLRIGFLRAPTDLALAKENGSLEKVLAAHNVKLVWAGPFSSAAIAVTKAVELPVVISIALAFIAS